MTTEQFIEHLYGSADQLIYFNIDRITWKDKPQTYSEAQSKLEWLNQDKHKDIYFIVNSGGSKDSQITRVNSAFIDWDAGRDSNKHYFPLEIVEQKKQEFLQKLAQFPYKPTYIIETRNGYHVYWFLCSGTTIEQFIFIQKQLITYFDSDPKICNPARVMKLPGYYACKNGQYDPFLVTIIEHNNVVYNVDTFISFFSSFHFDTENAEIGTTSPLPAETTISAHNNIYINKVYTRNIIMGTKRQTYHNKDVILLNTMEEVIDSLCRQNLAEYLKLDNYEDLTSESSLIVSCPFHNDSTPSASIYYHDDYCYLKCHSSNCDFGSGTIIKIVEMKDYITEGDAVIKLMDYYNIKLDDSWKTEEEIKYNNTIEVIRQCDDWKEQYPDLYKYINRIQADLISKIEFAKDNIKLRTTKGKSLFICSLTEFERISKNNPYITDQGRQNERVDRYCLLGLMEKMHKNEIPSGLYRMMQEVKGKKRLQYRIQCYHIPDYTPDLLKKADTIARIAKEKGIKMNSITKNSVREVFGEHMAKKLYPQVDDITPTDSSAQFLTDIETVLIEEISSKGYTTTAIVKDRLNGKATWKSVHDRRVKEHLPGLFEKHGLIQITATKKLKELFHIATKGYPKIIILAQDYNNISNKSAESCQDRIMLESMAAV